MMAEYKKRLIRGYHLAVMVLGEKVKNTGEGVRERRV